MTTKYIKYSSGYCYKIKGNKKTRISNEEYKKKTKRTKGGQIHESNLPTYPSKNIAKCASEKCNRISNFNSRITCMKNCVS